MLPVILNPATTRTGLCGVGEALERRRAVLDAAGVTPVEMAVSDWGDLASLDLLYVAGLDREASAALARRAKELGVLVNVEDEPELSDFHVPATVRRGDLLVTISSAGRSPGLVRMIREWLGERFGDEWGGRLAEIGRNRSAWQAGGLSASEISSRTRTLCAEWLP